jgi:uncharacterized protein involved in exopolysaccharide biosynthesis
MERNWEAVQGLLVRNETSVSSGKSPGQFADLYEMRTFQETILEVAKSQQVLTAALEAVDGTAAQPDAKQLEKLRKRIKMLPPNGAEFGKTEVFYLSVKDPDRERALRLVAELARQLQKRLGELRGERSEGLIAELEQQVELATQTHKKENSTLEALETESGSDLGELRLLHSATGGQSDLRMQSVEIEKEIRLTEERLREAEDLLAVLESAQQDPDQLVAMPSRLLSFQPTLQRLKDGLVDAQLQASKTSGTRTVEHPQVKVALAAVERIRGELHAELEVAIKGLEVDINLSRNRQQVLTSQYAALEQRLEKLAGLRAQYSSQVKAVEGSRSVLDQTRRQLSEVRARQVAARNSSLVTPLDEAETGPYPVGMGRTSVLGIGTIGGFVMGIGWLFLTGVPTTVPTTNALPAAANASETPAEKVSRPFPSVPVPPVGTRPNSSPVRFPVTAAVTPLVATQAAALGLPSDGTASLASK